MSIVRASKNDFYWADDREPHFQRRKEILEKHPEVKKLFGINTRLKYVAIFLVVVQLTVGFYIGQLSWLPFLLVTYVVGATCAAALFLAIHEITHNLAFKSKKYNNILALIANLPIVAPYAMSFKIYHSMHHWEQGKEGVDTDIPTIGEATVFKGYLGKFVWLMNQIVVYAIRPIFITRIKMDKWQIYNIIFQVSVISVYFYFAGIWAFVYLLLSMFMAGSIHPTAGHFISEHYVFEEGQETYSYYGPLNKIAFNVGYHNEHHDFPTIPGSRLPELRKMAPEFYEPLRSYDSWIGVLYAFVLNKDISLYSRTKRK